MGTCVKKTFVFKKLSFASLNFIISKYIHIFLRVSGRSDRQMHVLLSLACWLRCCLAMFMNIFGQRMGGNRGGGPGRWENPICWGLNRWLGAGVLVSGYLERFVPFCGLWLLLKSARKVIFYWFWTNCDRCPANTHTSPDVSANFCGYTCVNM